MIQVNIEDDVHFKVWKGRTLCLMFICLELEVGLLGMINGCVCKLKSELLFVLSRENSD